MWRTCGVILLRPCGSRTDLRKLVDVKLARTRLRAHPGCGAPICGEARTKGAAFYLMRRNAGAWARSSRQGCASAQPGSAMQDAGVAHGSPGGVSPDAG